MGGSFAKNNDCKVKHLQQSKSMLNGKIPTWSSKYENVPLPKTERVQNML